MEATFDYERAIREDKLTPLPETLARKVYACINPILPQQHQGHILLYQGGEELAKSFGSFKTKKALIAFSKQFVEEHQEKELTDQDKFIIAHELGHIFLNHAEKAVEAGQNSAKWLLVAQSCFVLALGILCLNLPVSWFLRLGAFISLCQLSFLIMPAFEGPVAALSQRAFHHRNELEADAFAAKQSLQMANGGALVYAKRIQEHQLVRQWAICKQIYPNTLTAFLKFCRYRYIFNSAGNVRFDFGHPPDTARLILCVQIIRQMSAQSGSAAQQ